MTYTVEIPLSVLKTLKRLPKRDKLRISLKIDDLANDPRPSGMKKLHGSDPLYRIRSGDYRILYEIHDRCLHVLIIEVGNRRESIDPSKSLTCKK